MSKELYEIFMAAIKAWIVGSIAGATIFVLGITIYYAHYEGIVQLIKLTILFAFFGFLIATPLVFLYAIPVYLWLNKLDRVNYFSILLIGLLPALLSGLFLRPMFWNALLHGGCIAILFLYFLRRSSAQQTYP